MEETKTVEAETPKKPQQPKDTRRYFCDYCGISRSKKPLLTSHLLSHHKEEIEKEKEKHGEDDDDDNGGNKSNTCVECGVSFKKPAYLKQHMRSHSIERPFVCTVDDCRASYRRNDHLNRHLLLHEGKLFSCSVEGCDRKFEYHANMKRHVEEIHEDEESFTRGKKHVCPEVGCGKVFDYASKLQKHVETHVKLDSVEAFCCEPDCLKPFSNAECLKAHLQSCHRYIKCEVCGTQQLKKNIKRHMQMHEGAVNMNRINCTFEGCLHTFSSKSNLNQHIKAIHLEQRPFVCRFAGCGKRFPFKHVRDNHEKCGSHVYVQGDFEEADEQFRSRPRGGLKRKCPTVEMLLRKRVTQPGQVNYASSQGSDYLAWLLAASDEDEALEQPFFL